MRTVVADFVRMRARTASALIAFGDAPYPLVPFTLDHGTVQPMIADIVPGMAGPRTALGDAIGLAIKMFDKSKVPEKVLVVLTDGNDTASKMPPDRAADIAKQSGIQHSHRRHRRSRGDRRGQARHRALQKIAEDDRRTLLLRTGPGQLAEIYATLDQITPPNQTTLSWRPRRELFHYPLGAAVALLIAYHFSCGSRPSVRGAHGRARAAS